jgi:hypothetical protein
MCDQVSVGSILIEMLDDERLRIEWFDTHEPVAAFTAAARIYTPQSPARRVPAG